MSLTAFAPTLLVTVLRLLYTFLSIPAINIRTVLFKCLINLCFLIVSTSKIILLVSSFAVINFLPLLSYWQNFISFKFWLKFKLALAHKTLDLFFTTLFFITPTSSIHSFPIIFCSLLPLLSDGQWGILIPPSFVISSLFPLFITPQSDLHYFCSIITSLQIGGYHH